MAKGKAAAAALGCDFGWRITEVPGVAHDGWPRRPSRWLYVSMPRAASGVVLQTISRSSGSARSARRLPRFFAAAGVGSVTLFDTNEARIAQLRESGFNAWPALADSYAQALEASGASGFDTVFECAGAAPAGALPSCRFTRGCRLSICRRLPSGRSPLPAPGFTPARILRKPCECWSRWRRNSAGLPARPIFPRWHLDYSNNLSGEPDHSKRSCGSLPSRKKLKTGWSSKSGALLGSLPVVILYSFFVDCYVSSMAGAVKE